MAATRRNPMRRFALTACLSLFAAVVAADIVTLKEGTKLNGTLKPGFPG